MKRTLKALLATLTVILVCSATANDSLTDPSSILDEKASSILAKLKLSSRTQAALYALREGIASLQDTESQPVE